MRRRITSSYYNYYRAKYRHMMMQIVARVLKSEDVEDGLQIADCELLWAMIHYDPSRGSLITYVQIRLAGRLRHYLKKRMREEVPFSLIVEDPMTLPVGQKGLSCWHDRDATLKIDLDDILSRCLLTDEERFVLESHFRDSMTLREIGDITSQSRTTIMNLKNSGLKKCIEYVQEQELCV